MLTPNVAVDSYYGLVQLAAGSVHRADWAAHRAGGKGVNFSRALSALGGSSLSLGFAGGHAGRFVVDEMSRERLDSHFAWFQGETRRCITVLAAGQEDGTVILDPGGEIPGHAVDELFALLDEHIHDASVCVMTGSLNPGVPETFYRDAIQRLRGRHVTVCVDASGAALQHAMEAPPDIVKVNRQEFLEFVGEQALTMKTLQSEFQKLSNAGLRALIVTDGADGAFVFSIESEPALVRTLSTERVVSSIGAGDTFLAGFVRGLETADSIAAAARLGSAAAAASLTASICGDLSLSSLDRLLSTTEVIDATKLV